MSIPFLDLGRQYQGIAKEVEEAVVSVLRSGAYIEGPEVKTLEQELADYIGVEHVVTCGNGTDALKLALKASGVGPGDEVITTPFSFFASPEAISNTGATPVFVDIEPDTLNIDPSKIEAAVTPRTKAILPVHIFGVPADMDRINPIAQELGVRVIEDACQAIGSVYKGKRAGALGDLGCFSFYPTKNLGAFGDAGMITTNDAGLANACRALKAHGAGKIGYATAKMLGREVGEEPRIPDTAGELYDPYKYYNYLIADNSRLDSIQAAILRVKLKNLNTYNESRREIAHRYSQALADLPIKLPNDSETADWMSCWHQYAVLVDEKDAFVSHLANAGVGTGAFYPVPLHLQKAYAPLGYSEGSLPVAEEVCRQSVCLPIFPELAPEEQSEIIDAIRGFFE